MKFFLVAAFAASLAVAPVAQEIPAEEQLANAVAEANGLTVDAMKREVFENVTQGLSEAWGTTQTAVADWMERARISPIIQATATVFVLESGERHEQQIYALRWQQGERVFRFFVRLGTETGRPEFGLWNAERTPDTSLFRVVLDGFSFTTRFAWDADNPHAPVEAMFSSRGMFAGIVEIQVGK